VRIDRATLRTFNVLFWILIVGVVQYNLYRKYQALSACESQQVRLDRLEAQLDSPGK
jgi:hypothetical protein